MKNKIDCDIIGIIGQSGLLLGRMASNGVREIVEKDTKIQGKHK